MADSETTSYQLSPTLWDLDSEFRSRTLVAGRDIAEWILRRHGEYGNDRAGRLLLPDRLTSSVSQPMDWWFTRTRALFRTNPVAEINGRILLLAIGMLDAAVGKHLWADGVLRAVADEVLAHYLAPPLPEPLSAEPTPRRTSS